MLFTSIVATLSLSKVDWWLIKLRENFKRFSFRSTIFIFFFVSFFSSYFDWSYYRLLLCISMVIESELLILLGFTCLNSKIRISIFGHKKKHRTNKSIRKYIFWKFHFSVWDFLLLNFIIHSLSWFEYFEMIAFYFSWLKQIDCKIIKSIGSLDNLE